MQIEHQTAAKRCKHPHAQGWLAVAYFVFVVLLGGLVLPTVLIGVISIAFDEATASIKQAKNDRVLVQRTVSLANSWMPPGYRFVTDEQVELFFLPIIWRPLGARDGRGRFDVRCMHEF